MKTTFTALVSAFSFVVVVCGVVDTHCAYTTVLENELL